MSAKTIGVHFIWITKTKHDVGFCRQLCIKMHVGVRVSDTFPFPRVQYLPQPFLLLEICLFFASDRHITCRCQQKQFAHVCSFPERQTNPILLLLLRLTANSVRKDIWKLNYWMMLTSDIASVLWSVVHVVFCAIQQWQLNCTRTIDFFNICSGPRRKRSVNSTYNAN